MFPEQPIPSHVPPELVRKDFPFVFGTTTAADPFNELADAVHGGPEIIFAPHAYPGGTPAWVPRRMEDLRAIYLDTEHFSSTNFSPFAKLSGGTWINSPAELDPPHHGPFRQMVNPAFTPSAMAALENKIREYTAGYIDGFARQGSCELMKDFAFEFPIKVFMELMGLPQERTQEFRAWEVDLLHNRDLSKKAAATRSVIEYLAGEIAERRARPRNDLISFGVHGHKNGQPLTQDEVLGFCFNLFIGGLDTVSNNVGLQFWHLSTHAEDQAHLRTNPAEISPAIDELMRAYGAVTTFRTCKRETTLRGVRFMPGDKIAMSTTLAGRDPAEFKDPKQVRFDRRPRHVAFGYGIHTCIGMHLAKRELRIAMEEFLKRIGPFEIEPGHRVRHHLGMIQPVELPIVWKTR